LEASSHLRIRALTSSMSDATGDFAGLVNENVRAVFLHISCIVGNMADARQLTEKTFIRVIEQGTLTRTQTNAAARLASVASEIAWDFLGQYGCRSCSEKAEPAPAFPAGFHLLTPMEREVMIMRDMNGLATDTVCCLNRLYQGHGSPVHLTGAYKNAKVFGTQEAQCLNRL
jgi:DNA-directed RNA polymerase specialized sigma24 family protein